MSSDLAPNYKPPIDEKDFANLTPPTDTQQSTSSYGFSHTMFRVKDPKLSIDFYVRILGMTVIRIMPVPEAKFTNYFLCYPQTEVPADPQEKKTWLWRQQGVLELCHNYGTELQPEFKHKTGNEPEFKGLG
jgi:lactoylglutathione lyase